MKVTMVDLVVQYQQIKEEIDEAIQSVLDSGHFVFGETNGEFEKRFAEYHGVKHALGCASGTDALQLSMMGLGLEKGDEIISVPMTFVATVEVMVLLGLKPVFVDIDPKTYCIDPGQIESKITGKTKAIVPVHLYGQSADMDPIMDIAAKHGLFVIEDCAQAIGATYRGRKTCTMANAGCISFFPGKNLGAYGDAGAVLTDDDDLAERIIKVRNHGSENKYDHKYLGVNSRLDAIQAAVLGVKLKYIDTWNEMRRNNGARYSELLSGLENVVCPYTAPENTHTYHQYTIQVEDRDGLRGSLNEKEIATGLHYPIPLHLQPAYKYLGYGEGDFPVSERASGSVLSLPMYPELPRGHQDYVVEQIQAYYRIHEQAMV
jgi:dTDP-4-amino-4,6-dideoxygalactose transaminase